jgi:DNA-binding IclR family transcriptional regulator
VSEISRDLGIPKAVVYRILSTLRLGNFLEWENSSRRYRLGLACVKLGSQYLANVDIHDIALEAMKRLSALSDETATLSVREGGTRIYVTQITPPREVKMTVNLGVPYELHAGSSSKAFLAHLPQDEQDEYLARLDLVRFTDLTKTDPALLKVDLLKIRDCGYAFSLGERQAGAGSIAAPVFDQKGQPVAVISICGPVDRIRKKLESFSEELLLETQRLSSQLGFQQP